MTGLGSYTYAETGYANPHAPTSINGQTLSYDNSGRVTRHVFMGGELVLTIATGGSGGGIVTSTDDVDSLRRNFLRFDISNR